MVEDGAVVIQVKETEERDNQMQDTMSYDACQYHFMVKFAQTGSIG